MGNIKDITGQKFGKLTVIGLDHIKHGAYWKCKCDCGNETVVNGTRLRRGDIRSCGCLIKETAHKRLEDFTGKQFGRLTVLEYDLDKNKWKCRCNCRNQSIVFISASSLKSGRTKSCGCLHDEVMHKLNFVDITGKQFGNLVVKEFAYKKNGKMYWRCHCNLCGNDDYIIERSKLGFTKSCGCLDISHSGSEAENEILGYIYIKFPNIEIQLHNRVVLDGKEIDIYLPKFKLGIEYNGSAFHATKNGVFCDKDKYYHRDKFLLAREKGIHLITIFDIDYAQYKWKMLEYINHAISSNSGYIIPYNIIEYTDNDYDDGQYMKDYGYEEIGQEEPQSFLYDRGRLVYRCGRTIWKLKEGVIA